MTVFDQLNFNQRQLTIQELQVLLEQLKEQTMRQALEGTQVITFGGPTLDDIEEKILHFSQNYFGMPYSDEARE